MNTYAIALLRGDGIGPEIVAEAVKVLDAAGQLFGFRCAYTDALLGGCAIDATGKPLPAETVEACLMSDAVLSWALSAATNGTPCPVDSVRRRACWEFVRLWGCLRISAPQKSTAL